MATYVQISGAYWRSNDSIFFEGKKINLDPTTTRVFFDTWATDGKRVFLWATERRGIDPQTFEALNNLYAKDAETCYARPTKISGADPETFEVLDSGLCRIGSTASRNGAGGFASDRTGVYHDGNRIAGADSTTFTSICDSFGRDAQCVYFEKNKLQGANPLRWRIVGGLYSQDDQRVFYMNKPVPQADPSRFYTVDHARRFAYDGVHFFCNGRVSSAQEFAEDMERDQQSKTRYIELLRSGEWEKLRYEESWSFRSPAEREKRDVVS